MSIIVIEIDATPENYWEIIEQIEVLKRPFILILYYKSFSKDIPFSWRIEATLRLRTLIINENVKVITIGEFVFNRWMQEWLNTPYIVPDMQAAMALAESIKASYPD